MYYLKLISLFVLGFEWKGDASMIRSSLPIDNVQLHGPGFIDIKLLWKELETKWNFQLPYQSVFCALIKLIIQCTNFFIPFHFCLFIRFTYNLLIIYLFIY